MDYSRRKFLFAASSAAIGLLAPKAYGDTKYTPDEYSFLEKSAHEQYDRIMQLWKDGKIPLRESVFAIEPYEKHIVEAAWERHIPDYLAIGVAVLENGGGPDNSSYCCRGIMQLSSGVARMYGLVKTETKTVKKGKKTVKQKVRIDNRGDPELNIQAGMSYLRHLHDDFFKDWEMAVQAYHSGPKRVMQGVSKYLNANKVVPNLVDKKGRKKKKFDWWDVRPSVIRQHSVNWARMMQNPQVYRFFRGLNDDTENYLPKALACYKLYTNRNSVFG